MISAILFFFGVTLIYTGILTMQHDPAIGLAVAFAGLVLTVKPVLEALRYIRTVSPAEPGPYHRPQKGKKERTAKIHLRVVKSGDDDRPTIH